MKMTRILLAALAAGAIGTGGATAAPIMIDDFNTTQILTLPGPGPGDINSASATGLAGILGGQRDLRIIRTDANPGATPEASTNINQAFAGQATASNDAGVIGLHVFQYDGADQSGANANGLGGIDLTDGGTNQFFNLGIQAVDLANTQFIVFVHSGAGNFSTATFAALGAILVPITQQFTFASFVTAGGTGADFTNVTAVQLSISNTAGQPFDARIDLFEANGVTTTSGVPEPSMLALIGVGILGLGLARRRRS